MSDLPSPLHKRLKEALKSAGKTQADIARAIGATPTTVHLLLNGVIKKLRGDYALAIEEATGFASQWLIRGTGPKKRGTNPPLVCAEADPRVKRLEELHRIVEDLASAAERALINGERIRAYRPKGSMLWGFTEDAKEVPKCTPDWEYAEFVRVK